MSKKDDINVLGGKLETCSMNPLTGFFRDGCCRTDENDHGSHTVCCVVTAAFLRFSFAKGNDLTTPRPEYRFPGLKPGDRWCVCAARWLEAFRAGAAPLVVMEATHVRALDIVPLDALQKHVYVEGQSEADRFKPELN